MNLAYSQQKEQFQLASHLICINQELSCIAVANTLLTAEAAEAYWHQREALEQTFSSSEDLYSNTLWGAQKEFPRSSDFYTF